MKKFIFSFALVAVMGAFASCGNTTNASASQNDSDSVAVVDTMNVDSVDTVK